jgi:hypothetical protein
MSGKSLFPDYMGWPHRRRRPKTSRYRGVSLRASRGTWIASIVDSSGQRYLGSYKTEVEAAHAYNAAMLALGWPAEMMNKIPASHVNSRP